MRRREIACNATFSGGSRGGSGGSHETSPRPSFKISYAIEITWSQRDQIISFSWDI